MDPDGPVAQATTFLSELEDVVVVSLALALYALLVWLVYRSMMDPRLPVIRADGRPPRVTWGGVARYVLTTIPMVSFWFVVILGLLVLATTGRSTLEISAALAAIIGGTRILAHVNPNLAHEIAKIVPLVLLSVVLVGGTIADEGQLARVADEFESALPVFSQDLYALIVLDFAVTALWFLRLRVSWARSQRRARRGKPVAGPVTRAWRRWKAIGYGPDPATGENPQQGDAGRLPA